jgi:hypothetical protein
LVASNHATELVEAIKNSTVPLHTTAGWILRMTHTGMKLRFSEAKIVLRAINFCLDNQKVADKQSGLVSGVAKPNIQERIQQKLKQTMADIDGVFDDFTQSGYQGLKFNAELLIDAPGNRMKDIILYCEKYLNEYRAVQANGKKDQELVEAYSHLGKRELKACIQWWENAIQVISNFGQSKKNNRKPRKRKQVSPEKIVGKLRFVKAYPELKLTSIDPTQILKASELWIFNTKTRKLGRYVASGNSTLDVKGTRLTNIDPIKSIQKVLRKPKEQLTAFGNLGKPASVKWFDGIRATAIKLKESISKDCVLLKVVK